MKDMLLLAAAAAVVAAYVCRFDPLSWARTPGLMLGHFAGAVPAMWVVKVSALDIVQPVHLVLLGVSALVLVVLYPLMPKAAPPAVPAPAPVQPGALERVRGGSKPPEQAP